MDRSLNTVQQEVLALERFFPHHNRDRAERILFALSILSLSFTVFFNVMINSPAGRLWPIAQGLFLVCFSLLLITILIEIYFHSLRIRLEKQHEISFATLLVIGLHHPRKKDLAKAFLHSHLGREVALRLGIGKESLRHFMENKKNLNVSLLEKGYFPQLAGHIHDEDPYFRDFLERVEVSRDHLVTTADVVEKKHHRHLSSRPFLKETFHKKEEPVFSLDHITRNDIEELEHFYHIIITEQATQQIIAYFREDMLRFVSENERIALLTELIETSLSAHKERFHGASVIMPADVRGFLIHKKAEY